MALLERRAAARRAILPTRRFAPPDPAPAPDGPGLVHLPHAGLVLLAAHLAALFARLGLTSAIGGGRTTWRDAEARGRGVHLLRWLGDARCDAPEPDLALEKLLCGMAIEDVVPPAIRPTAGELRTCASLLDMAVARWPAMRGSSAAALREGFLQRPGCLARRQDGWRVEVERRGVDVLLGSLPWPLALPVRLPWMAEALAVDWRGGA